MFSSWFRRESVRPKVDNQSGDDAGNAPGSYNGPKGSGLSPVAEEPGSARSFSSEPFSSRLDGSLATPTGDLKAWPPLLIEDAKRARATTPATIAEAVAGSNSEAGSPTASETSQLMNKYHEYLMKPGTFSDPWENAEGYEEYQPPLFERDQSAFDKAAQELALRLTGKASVKPERDYWFEDREYIRKEDFEHFRQEKELEASLQRQLIIEAGIKTEDLQRYARLQTSKLDVAEERVRLLENKGIRLAIVEYNSPEVRPRVPREKFFDEDSHLGVRSPTGEDDSNVRFIYDDERGQQSELLAEALLQRAYLKMILGDWDGMKRKAAEALSIAKTELQYKPLEQRAMFYVGVACYQTGELEKAVEMLGHAEGCKGKYREGSWVIGPYRQARADWEEHQRHVQRQAFERDRDYLSEELF